MNSVDVEIYMSNLQKFFKENPNDLMSLIPIDKENEFYVLIRELASQNFESRGEAALTKTQMLDICRQLHTASLKLPTKKENYITTIYGGYSLN